MRTLVTFESTAFHTTISQDYFINPSCFGDDVARWMMEELRNRGFSIAGEPAQEDFGWYLTFRVGDVEHDFVIGFRPGDSPSEGLWIGWLERRRGLVGSILGRRQVGVQHDAIHAIHAILSNSPQVQRVRWHVQADFDDGLEQRGIESPL